MPEPPERNSGPSALHPERAGGRIDVSPTSAPVILAGVAVALVASQAVLAVLAGSIRHDTATQIRAVLPLILLIAGPAALGLVVGVRLVQFGDRRSALAIMIATGLMMRLVWFAAPAPLEDDYFRYLWDGAVVAAGLDPYALAPEDVVGGAGGERFTTVLAQGSHIAARINFPELTSIYPGTAQLAFAVAHFIAPWRLDGLRLLFVLADAATLLLMMSALASMGRPRLLAAYYWCNPLVVLATTATAHVDALLPPLVLAAILSCWRRRDGIAAALLALATGVKLWPVLLAPLLARHVLLRGDCNGAAGGKPDTRLRNLLAPAWICLALTALLCLPLVATLGKSSSGLAAYGSGWANNNAIFAWTEDIIETVLDGVVDIDVGRWLRLASAAAAVLCLLAIAARRTLRPQALRDLLAGGLFVSAAVFYLSPAQFPWYALWFLPLAATLAIRPLLLASVLLPLYYLSFPLAEQGDAELFDFWIALGHALPVLAWSAWVLRHRSVDVPVSNLRQPVDIVGEMEAAVGNEWLRGRHVAVIIPTRNEAAALPRVIERLPAWVESAIVADYRSTDGTPDIARSLGALVVDEPRPGYGRACLSAIAALPAGIDTVVFLDGDASDEPAEMRALVQPIADGNADLVIGSRTRGRRERGALTPQQQFGNWLACRLMRLFWGVDYSDLGPFRAIDRVALQALGMRDQTYGWTVEMQVLAARGGLRAAEVPVTYRRRIGLSKISGTISGIVKAGTRILWVIAREALWPAPTKPVVPGDLHAGRVAPADEGRRVDT